MDVLKTVYRRFIDTKERRKRLLRIKPLAEGGVSQIFIVNSNLVGKVAKFSTDSPFLDNKLSIWVYLHERFAKDEDKGVLDKLVSLPYYKEFEHYDKEKYLVSLEPLIHGKSFARCLLEDDAMSKDFKKTDENFFKVFYILFDLLLYLGETFKFNHNDLHFDNVMIVKAEDIDMCTYQSMYLKKHGHKAILKDIKYVPIIIDFDWATITNMNVSQMEQYYKVRMDECVREPYIGTHFCKIHRDYGYKGGTPFSSEWSHQIDTAMFLGMFEYANIAKESSLFRYLEMVKNGKVGQVLKSTETSTKTITTDKQKYNLYYAFDLLHQIETFPKL
jgi:hypothetical protein